jgi:hypothetical protein
MTLKVGQPAVNVRIPEIKMPQIKATVNVDVSGIESAVNSLAQSMQQIAQQQYALLEMIREHHYALNSIIGNQPNIEVAAPIVKMPARPRSFSVEVEGDDGEMTYMNIVANSSN